MAISIDWGTRVVTIPQADLNWLGGSNYELDTNWLRIQLRDQEDSEAGVVHPPTHNHNTTVLLGGIEYARIIEMINNFTITFEEQAQPYSVNLTGSNNNILDVTNLGTVQIRSNNSAGLINIPEIQAQMYERAVTVNVLSPYTGTTYPTGTSIRPVNNIPDAILIATIKGYDQLDILGDLLLDTGDDVSGFTLLGQNPTRSTITINAGADTFGCEILHAAVTGNLDGGTILRDCVISNLNYINGYVYSCMLDPGVISLGGTDTAHFLNCYSGVPGVSTPTIDMDGTGGEDTPLAMRGYNGGIKLIHKTGTASCSIDLASGQVIIDSTCVAGTIVVRGDGKVVDENGNHMNSGVYNGGLTLLNECNFGGHVYDLWQLLGLDPDNPSTIETTQHTVGNIVISITKNQDGSVVLTRTS